MTLAREPGTWSLLLFMPVCIVLCSVLFLCVFVQSMPCRCNDDWLIDFFFFLIFSFFFEANYTLSGKRMVISMQVAWMQVNKSVCLCRSLARLGQKWNGEQGIGLECTILLLLIQSESKLTSYCMNTVCPRPIACANWSHVEAKW